MNPSSETGAAARRWLWAWLLATAVSLALSLGSYPLIDPDEGRNAMISREMLESGDLILPTYDTLPFVDKPALYFVAVAASMRALGASELAARLPSVLFSWATIAVTVWFAHRLFGRRAMPVAGIACATAPWTVAFARTAIFDAMLTFFVVLALVALYCAVEDRGPAGRVWAAVGWLAITLGVLTKGPVALAVPLLVAVPYAWWRRVRWAPFSLWGGLGLVAVVAPWAWRVEAGAPGFLRYALITETWQRMTSDELRRAEPVWYFLPYFVGAAYPWLAVAIAGARHRLGVPTRRLAREVSARPPLVFLVLWLALPLLLFSLSASKRPQYILPLVPPVALLVAWVWDDARATLRGTRAGAVALLIVGSVLAGAWAVFASGLLDLEDHQAPAMAAATLPTTAALAVTALAASIVAWVFAKRPAISLVALSLPVVLLTPLSATLAASIAHERSEAGMAAAVRPRLADDAVVVGIETFSSTLSFYLRRPLVLCSDDGRPLGTNYVIASYQRLVETSPMLEAGNAWREILSACSKPTFFLIKPHFTPVRRELEAAGLDLVYEGDRRTLFGPCKGPAP